MLFIFVFFLFIFFIFFNSLASQAADSHDPKWLNLLRYKTISSAGYLFESEVIPSEFFLAPQGSKDPKAELQANLEEARKNARYACRFPARWSYFIERGWIEPRSIPPGLCQDYEYFQKKLSAESVSIVFAAFYIHSAGSAFGHTLFKINGRGEKNVLLDHGASFAANLTTRNPIIYAWNGLTGGFTGNFTLLPYYFKIREYNHSEHRDLWEYPLRLTPKQVEFFVAHLWEMDLAQFRYYYLTENCSYHLLRHLDAVEPEWNLTKKMSTISIPTQTLNAIHEVPGFVDSPKFRPSQFTVLEARYKNLSQKLKARIPAKIDETLQLEQKDLTQAEWTELLDFTIDDLDARYPREFLFESTNPKIAQAKERILILRSKLPRQAPPQIETPSAPHGGHPERRWSVGNFLQGNHFGPLLGYRFAFHDFMDRDEGRPRWSALVIGDLELSYDVKTQLLSIPHFSIAHASSSPSVLGLLGGLSWSWDFGIEDPVVTLNRDLAGFLSPGVGLTWINTENLILSTMIMSSLRYSGAFKDSSFWGELGPSLKVGLANAHGKISFQAMRHWVLSQAYENYTSVSLSGNLFISREANLQARYLSLPESNRTEIIFSWDF